MTSLEDFKCPACEKTLPQSELGEKRPEGHYCKKCTKYIRNLAKQRRQAAAIRAAELKVMFPDE